MVNLIARRNIYRTKAGGLMRVTKQEAVVLRALNLAYDAPAEPAPAPEPEPARPKRTYQRRDMAAEAVVEPAPKDD